MSLLEIVAGRGSQAKSKSRRFRAWTRTNRPNSIHQAVIGAAPSGGCRTAMRPRNVSGARIVATFLALVLTGLGLAARPQPVTARSISAQSSPNAAIPDNGYDGTLGSMLSSTVSTTALIPAGHVAVFVSLDLGIDHTWVGELTVKLRSPTGNLLTVLERPAGDAANPLGDDGTGSGGDNSDVLSLVPLGFGDNHSFSAESAGQGIGTDGAVCFNDSRCAFRPTPDRASGPRSFAEAFSGQQARGDWTLYVGDSVGGDTGTLTNWTLHLRHVRPLSPCSSAPFPDVPVGHPFCSEIAWMRDEGISQGFGDGSYRPSEVVTRQSIAAFLARLAVAQPLPDCTEPPFTDVPVNHPFCREINWMELAGISSGYEDGTYRPALPVTRQSMSSFLFKVAHGPPYSCTSRPFADVPTNHPFCVHIQWMRDWGITVGFADGTFRPGESVTRQSMSAFLYRTDFRV